MGIFDRFFRKKSLQPVNGGGWRSIINEPFAGAWQQNQELKREDVLSFNAVFACISLISQDMGKLWLNLKKENDGIFETVKDKRFGLIEKPNKLQTRQQFIESWIISKLTRGNTYVLKYRDAFGEIIGLYVLNPDLVTPLIDDFGNAFYQINTDKAARVDTSITLPASEIIHDRFNCFYHPLVGLSPIMACGLSAGMGLSIQKNAASFFGNMSRPSGILVAPGPIDSDKAAAIRAKWNANYSAGNYGQTAILGDGMTYVPMSVAASDAQMLEQLKYSGEVVCSVFHVPAFKVGMGSLPAGIKTGDQNEIYYADCLQGLIEAIETLLTEHLELQRFGYSIEFDLDSLIRMDAASQMTYLKDGVAAGLIAPNEGRQKLNLKPVTGGESPLIQQQNYSLQALAKRDAKDDPFSTSKPALPAPQPSDQGKSIDVLLKRIEQLEARPAMQYKGVFDADESYVAGDMITYQGSMWHCEKNHHGEFAHEAFKLAVKKGRDARVQE